MASDQPASKRPPDPGMAGSPNKAGAPNKKKGKLSPDNQDEPAQAATQLGALSLTNFEELQESQAQTESISQFGTIPSQADTSSSSDPISDADALPPPSAENPTSNLAAQDPGVPASTPPTITSTNQNPVPSQFALPLLHPHDMPASDRAACPALEYTLCYLATGVGFPEAGSVTGITKTLGDEIRAAIKLVMAREGKGLGNDQRKRLSSYAYDLVSGYLLNPAAFPFGPCSCCAGFQEAWAKLVASRDPLRALFNPQSRNPSDDSTPLSSTPLAPPTTPLTAPMLVSAPLNLAPTLTGAAQLPSSLLNLASDLESIKTSLKSLLEGRAEESSKVAGLTKTVRGMDSALSKVVKASVNLEERTGFLEKRSDSFSQRSQETEKREELLERRVKGLEGDAANRKASERLEEKAKTQRGAVEKKEHELREKEENRRRKDLERMRSHAAGREGSCHGRLKPGPS